jgi:AraC-like DNA-binding protein
MFYKEFTPHVSLAPWVRCIWLFESSIEDGVGEVQKIVPDGFPELLLHYGDQFHEVSADGVPSKQSRLIFAGQISSPLTLQPGAIAGVMGVRFWPAAAHVLLRLPMTETTDQRLNMADVLGASTNALIDEIFCAPNHRERLSVMERFLIARLFNNQHHGVKKMRVRHAALAHCVARLYHSGGEISVDRLANMANLSSRQLERHFLSDVGISPRLLASIFRFRRVFDFMSEPSPSLEAARWTDAALAAGYFDQAHMIRDFKRFAGQTPLTFYRSLQGISAAMVLRSV